MLDAAPIALTKQEERSSLTRSYASYREHFGTMLRFVAPAALLSYLTAQWFSAKAAELMRTLPHGLSILSHKTQIAQFWLVRIAPYAVSWVTYSFSLAAISLYLADEQDDSTGARSDISERLIGNAGRVLAVAAVLFLIGFISYWAIFFGSIQVLFFFHGGDGWNAVLISTILCYLLLIVGLFVMSRWSAAIPFAANEGTGVITSLRESAKATRDKRAVLTFVIVESILVSYLGFWLPFWIAQHLLHQYTAIWQYWTVFGLAMCLSVLSQPPMLIAFSEVYCQSWQKAGA